MPSFQDSAFIILLGLLLFGPKGLANIARQIGKLMGEFRRASSDFRNQMEDELRVSEQADQQKKIAAMEAAAPPTPRIFAEIASDLPEPDHPHMPPPEPVITPEPLPIASSGQLDLMPPATGLPVPRGRSVGAVFDAIPHTPDPEPSPEASAVEQAGSNQQEATHHA